MAKIEAVQIASGASHDETLTTSGMAARQFALMGQLQKSLQLTKRSKRTKGINQTLEVLAVGCSGINHVHVPTYRLLAFSLSGNLRPGILLFW